MSNAKKYKVWVYTDAETGDLIKSPILKKTFVHHTKPSYANVNSCESNLNRKVRCVQATLTLNQPNDEVTK